MMRKKGQLRPSERTTKKERRGQKKGKNARTRRASQRAPWAGPTSRSGPGAPGPLPPWGVLVLMLCVCL